MNCTTITPGRLRSSVVATLAIGLAAAVPVGAGAAGNERTEYTYTANSHTWVVGPDMVAEALAAETGMHTAPIGNVYLGRVWSRSVDITVDDLNTTLGKIPVSVTQQRGSRVTNRTECVPVGERTTLRGIKRGHVVTLTVYNDAYGQQLCGGPGGTTGILTVHR